MFGKLMSISDGMMWAYFDLLTDRTPADIAALRSKVEAGSAHPMDIKMSLAREIIAGFHGAAAAEAAAAEFQRIYRDRQAPSDVPVFRIAPGTHKLLTLLTQSGLASSRSDAERLVRGRGVEIDEQVVDKMNHTVNLSGGQTVLIHAGKKKFLRIVVE
jgi:tyrosyl-tRNA synthetase